MMRRMMWVVGLAACSSGSPSAQGRDAGSEVDSTIATSPDAAVALPDSSVSQADSSVDPGDAAALRAPGAACSCDDQCQGTATNPAMCFHGICMVRGSANCSGGGTQPECPTGSRCWNWAEDETNPICWPDFDAVPVCAGIRDSDGSCAPDGPEMCDQSCSVECGRNCPANATVVSLQCVCNEGFVESADGSACVPRCTAESCTAGQICAESGRCVDDVGQGPTGAPPADCQIGMNNIPEWRCTENCGELVAFTPVMGPGYDNYPLNGETAQNQYRSFIRRDVMMMVKYAAAMVECQSRAWPFGNHMPIGLGDMSEANGAIPGTSINSPGHPAGTHVNGRDMDLGYYQLNTANNYLRPICEHVQNGTDQYHCVSAPTTLDVWRSTLFIAHLHTNPNLRVIGVDGRAGEMFTAAWTRLCSMGWIGSAVCGQGAKLAYEVTNMGQGWFQFHHHHFHISYSVPR